MTSINCVEEIPVPAAPESLPGQLDLFAEREWTEEEIFDFSRRECSRCNHVYSADERCCPVCTNPEFGWIRKPGVPMTAVATAKKPSKPAKKKAEPKSPTLKAMKANLPKDRTTKKYKDEFDPMKLEAKPAATAPDAPAETPAFEAVGEFRMIDILLTDHNPKNVRTEMEIEADPATQELADTIKAIGLIQPIVVRPVGRRYVVEAGCRRRIACHRAGLKNVPCIVRASDSDTVAVEVRVIENLQRKDLTPIQEANELQELQTALNLGQVELGKKVGKSQGYVSQRLSLLKLSQPLQQLVDEGALSVTQGRELAVLADLPEVVKALEKEFKHRLMNWQEHNGDGKTIDRDNYCYAVGGVIDVHMRPMQPTGALSPSFVPSDEQLAQLDVRELCLDGDTRERWAGNVKLWDRLQKEAKAQQEAEKEEAARKAAEKPAATASANATVPTPAAAAAPTPGEPAGKTPATTQPAEKPKPEAKALSAAEQKERDERNAAIFQKRLYRYKIKWLQMALAKRASQLTQEQALVLWIAFALYGSDQKRAETFAHAVKEVMGSRFSFSYENIYALDRGKLPKLLANYFDRWCHREARNATGDANPQLVEILARELAIDIGKEWKLDAEFLEIHTIDQLTDLAKEWGITIDSAVSGKGPTVEYLVKKHGKAGAVTFPKALAKVKPVHLD